MSVSVETRWKCYPCSKIFKTHSSLTEHERSKKHKKSAKAYLEQHPEHSMSSIFKSIKTESSDFLSDINRSINAHNEPLTVDEDSDLSKQAVPEKTTLESLRVCLFCNLETDGVKKNLDHMRFRHNFTILDIECLINLKGILAYIAERIQLGKLCLYCDKQFRSAQRAQQHMRDKGHCMMPFDKDQEFELFYDFARAYRDFAQKPMITAGDESEQPMTAVQERQIEKNQRLAAAGEGGGSAGQDEEVSSDDWEDVDCADGEMEEVEEVGSDEEEGSSEPSSQSNTQAEEEGKSEFTIINGTSASDAKPPSSSSFSLIDSKAMSSNVNESANKTESFEVIGDSASSIADDNGRGGRGGPVSTSSYSSALENVIKNSKRGKTRAQAFANLDIQKAELLATGEIKLPNGKIIGHRDYKHIYRQRTRLPDQREAIVINKLALEYRKMRNEQNGVVLAQTPGALARTGLDQ